MTIEEAIKKLRLLQDQEQSRAEKNCFFDKEIYENAKENVEALKMAQEIMLPIISRQYKESEDEPAAIKIKVDDSEINNVIVKVNTLQHLLEDLNKTYADFKKMVNNDD